MHNVPFSTNSTPVTDFLSGIVSTPSHERYGKHVTPAEVNKLVKPSGDALSDVHDWLESHGVDRAQLSYSSAKERIKAQLPVSDIERLLDTQYFICEHEDGTQLVRAAAWSLSSHLHEHIETMQPTNSFFRPKPHRRSLNIVQPDIGIREEPCLHQKKVLKVSKDVTLAQVCNPTTVTPICLRTLYGTIDYVPGMPGKDKVALNNYLRLVMRNRSDKLATAIGVSTRLASALWDRAELEEPISVDEFENHLRAAECHPALTALASLCDLERVLGTRKNGT